MRLTRYDGLTAAEQVMICWDGVETRCVQTYEVLFGTTLDGPFTRINPVDTLCTCYLIVPAAPGYYRVRAVDYWGRHSSVSDVVTLEL